MIFAVIVFVLLLIGILLLMIMFVTHSLHPRQPLNPFQQQLIKESVLQAGFCDPVTGSCAGSRVTGPRGLCQVYNTLSTETEVVDRLTPIATYPSLPIDLRCQDGFISALQKYQHICQTSQCLGYDGKLYTAGQTELYYQSCQNLQPCSTGRSAYVFNFFPSGTQLNANAVCLQADVTGAPTLTPGVCQEGNSMTDNIFLNIDQIQIGGGASYVRLRIPFTESCLSSNLNVQPCLNLSNSGYLWVSIPTVNETTGSVYYPSQLLLLNTALQNVITQIAENPNITPGQIFQYLSSGGISSLQLTSVSPNGQLTLQPIYQCNSQGQPAPPCVYNGEIVGGALWESLTG